MYSVITQNRNDAQYLTRIIADSEADLPQSPNFSPGSTAITADTGNEYMLNNQKQWFKYVVKTSGGGGGSSDYDPRGHVPTPMGTIASVDDLPATGNRLYDMYMVGPNEDGSYDEYYWTANNTWDLMGKSIPNLDDVIKEQVLYSGNDKSGTVENPADGTILKTIYNRISTVDDKINSLDFKRLDNLGNESDFVDEVSVLINNNVIDTFFAPTTVANMKDSFVAEELVSYLTDNNITPTTYDGETWTAAVHPIADMTSANGPYLVLITQVKDTKQYHIKNLHQIFVNTISEEIQDLDDLREAATKINILEQEITDMQNTLNTLDESSTLQII